VEHVTDKEYIGTLLAQIKEQQEAYVLLYNRNLALYNELKTMDAYALQLTEVVTEANKIIASGRHIASGSAPLCSTACCTTVSHDPMLCLPYGVTKFVLSRGGKSLL
jgi:formyltetrahydrofolate synthetase